MKIAIGIPAYNEEKNIASIITKLKKSQIQLSFAMMVRQILQEILQEIWAL